MAVSQFIIYTSSDPYGPGYITGNTGSLITILTACLINGYGSGSSYYKPAAGWLKPFPDVSGSLSMSVLACYQQPSGSQFTLFVNDSTPHQTALGKESWIVGWEAMTSLTGSGSNFGGTHASGSFTGSNGQGYGYGQFPLPIAGQSSTGNTIYGHFDCRKSATADTSSRPWILAADASTMYMWISTGDPSGYVNFGFGDCYSLRGAADLWRCFIYGKYTDNLAPTPAGANNCDFSDCISMGAASGVTNQLSVALPGHCLARTSGGTGGSTPFTRKGDGGVCPFVGTSPQTVYAGSISGVLQTPNGTDNSLYLSPLWLVEPSGSLLRGRFRGLYQVCHPIANFTDGQIIQGAGDYAGKTLMIIRTSPASSMWALETSPTVETN